MEQSKRDEEGPHFDSSSISEPPAKRPRRQKMTVSGKARDPPATPESAAGSKSLSEDPIYSHTAYTAQLAYLDSERSLLLEKKARLRRALRSLHADERMLLESQKRFMSLRKWEGKWWDMLERHKQDMAEFGKPSDESVKRLDAASRMEDDNVPTSSSVDMTSKKVSRTPSVNDLGGLFGAESLGLQLDNMEASPLESEDEMMGADDGDLSSDGLDEDGFGLNLAKEGHSQGPEDEEHEIAVFLASQMQKRQYHH
ncbi:hypothetical protein HDU67_000934 [Dinochytrium kinnereticum]|nr:hypothetical protein HDU67_000934 [Dinochytrium kinnereticum]